MGREKHMRSGCRARQIDNEISGFGRQRNALVRIIETDGGGRHAELLELIRYGRGDCSFLAGYALDRQEAHQMRLRRRHIEWNLRLTHGTNLSIDEVETYRPQGSPSTCQRANSAVHRMNIHMT